MNDGAGEIVKLKVVGYSDNKFKEEVDSMEVQLNPSSLKFEKGAELSGGKVIGRQKSDRKYGRSKPAVLKFEMIFDETGVLYENSTVRIVPVEEIVNRFEKIAGEINNETHRPNYLIVNWGTFIFRGQSDSMSYDYTLFRPDGSPLRVKITISIEEFQDLETEALETGRQSADLTRRIMLKAGETIPGWCLKIYGDPSYCVDIARVNNLSNFRDVAPGRELVFPSLQRKNG